MIRTVRIHCAMYNIIIITLAFIQPCNWVSV